MYLEDAVGSGRCRSGSEAEGVGVEALKTLRNLKPWPFPATGATDPLVTVKLLTCRCLYSLCL